MENQKYYWKIGSPPPVLDQHSQVKHAIIEEYIRRYVLTLMANARIPELTLSIIDGFSGGGCYLTEEGGLVDGSPLLIMRAVREARALLNIGRRQHRSVNVEYFFVDIMPDTTDYLKFLLRTRLDENLIELDDFDKTHVFTDDFFGVLPRIFKRIQQRKRGEHSLFVLDQYCYKDIPIQGIKTILGTLKSAEVVMTFNVDNLITYLSDSAANRKAIRNIGLDAYIPWDELRQIKATNKQNREWRKIIQRYVADGIQRETNAKYMTLFFVKPFGSNSWSYWLIHLTNNYRAHDVMKSVHWEHNTEFGHELAPGVFVLGYDANIDIDYTGQSTFVFSENKSTEDCINGVMDYFGKAIFQHNQPTKLADLFQANATNSPAAETHKVEAVRRLRSMKNVIITSEDGKNRGVNKSYKLTDIIKPSKQIILL